MAVGDRRKVVADHNDNHRHHQKCIVLRTGLRPRGLRLVRLFPFFQCRHHPALGRQNSHPHVRSHDRAEHRPQLQVSRAPREVATQKPRQRGHQYKRNHDPNHIVFQKPEPKQVIQRHRSNNQSHTQPRRRGRTRTHGWRRAACRCRSSCARR